jgi:hypothetical protein
MAFPLLRLGHGWVAGVGVGTLSGGVLLDHDVEFPLKEIDLTFSQGRFSLLEAFLGNVIGPLFVIQFGF